MRIAHLVVLGVAGLLATMSQAAEKPASPPAAKPARPAKPAPEAPPPEGKDFRRRESRPVLDLPDLEQYLSAPAVPKDLGDAEMMTIANMQAGTSQPI